jgi:hypothetical protein
MLELGIQKCPFEDACISTSCREGTSRVRKTLDLVQSLNALTTEFKGLVSSGKIVPLSGTWGGRRDSWESENESHTNVLDAKFLAMTRDGIRVAKCHILPAAGGGYTHTAVTVLGEPNLLSCLRASKTISVEDIRETMKGFLHNN